MDRPAIAEPSLGEAYRYCQRLTKRRAGNFYYAFLPLPRAQRLAIYAVYAFSRVSDDYSDEALPAERKLALLNDHRNKLHECYTGKAGGPVFIALADVIKRYAIPQSYFDDLLNGVVQDLTVARYPTFAELRGYCYLVASVVGLICIKIFGYREAKAEQYAIDLGIGMQLVNIMRDVKEDAERGRVYLPQDEMTKVGYREEDLRRGVVNDAFRTLMKLQGERAREYLNAGSLLLPLITGKQARVCPAILRGLYTKVLERIEGRGYDVFTKRARLSPREKTWIALSIWSATTVKNLLPAKAPSS
jgi:phytoene synthase